MYSQGLGFSKRWPDFPGGAVVKNLPSTAGDASSLSGRETEIDPTCHGAAKAADCNY